MNPYTAVYRQAAQTGWTRIDLLLALLDGAIERIEKAAALARDQAEAAAPLVRRSRLIVMGLVSCINPGMADPVSHNLLRLYEFVDHCLQSPTVESLQAALKVLRTLQEGFQGIRDDAQRLERAGLIPAADAACTCQTVA